MTAPGKIGLICTRTEIHFIDGYYNYTCNLSFHTGKTVIDGQVCFRWPCKMHASQFRSCVTHERCQPGPVAIWLFIGISFMLWCGTEQLWLLLWLISFSSLSFRCRMRRLLLYMMYNSWYFHAFWKTAENH